MKLRLSITIALLVFVLTFTLQNTAIVEIQLLFWRLEMPRSIMIFMMILIGFVVGWFTRAMSRLAKAVE